MQVNINGKSVPMFASTVSYGDVVEAAGYNKERVLTVTYAVRGGGISGNLLPGAEVQLVENMMFNVANTSNA